MNHVFKTILIYEAIAFLGWNIMVRTQSDYEMWLFENIHRTIYIMLASGLLLAVIVYVSKLIGKKFNKPKIFKPVSYYTSPSPRD